jgi:hypothetical protein
VIRRRNASAIQPVFQFGCKGIEHRAFGPARLTRRHHSTANFTDNLLPGLWILADIRHVKQIKGELANLSSLIVAGDAVLIQQRLLCRNGCWSLRVACKKHQQDRARTKSYFAESSHSFLCFALPCIP